MTNPRRLSYILAVTALWAAGGAARASGIIHDPAMGVERGDLSTAIFQGANFAPGGGGGGIFGFYNAGTNNITELLFEVDIAPGLDPGLVQSAFSCDSGNSNPFFYF